MLGSMGIAELILVIIVVGLGVLVWKMFYDIVSWRKSSSKKKPAPFVDHPGRSGRPRSEPDRASSREFTFDLERQAAAEHRRVWIDYEDNYGDETERKIEIYNAQDDEHLFAWCCLRQGPRTFRRDRIKCWKVLNEQFDFNPLLERWFREEYPQGDNAIPWPRFKEMNG